MEERADKKVVGLKYEAEEGLPRVILKGSGKLADDILEAQKKPGSPPLVKDERLLRELYKLPVDGEIGADLFELVAIMLVRVFAIENRREE